MWYSDTIQCYVIINRNGVLINDTTWMNFEIMLVNKDNDHILLDVTYMKYPK